MSAQAILGLRPRTRANVAPLKSPLKFEINADVAGAGPGDGGRPKTNGADDGLSNARLCQRPWG